jgi:hypothetical protein
LGYNNNNNNNKMKNTNHIKFLMERIESPRLTDSEYQKRAKQLSEDPIRRDIGSHEDMTKYGRNTKWAPAGKHYDSERYYNLYTEKFGPFTVYINDDDSIKIACLEDGDCFDQTDRKVSREEAAQMLGVESLDMIEESKTKRKPLTEANGDGQLLMYSVKDNNISRTMTIDSSDKPSAKKDINDMKLYAMVEREELWVYKGSGRNSTLVSSLSTELGESKTKKN